VLTGGVGAEEAQKESEREGGLAIRQAFVRSCLLKVRPLVD